MVNNAKLWWLQFHSDVNIGKSRDDLRHLQTEYTDNDYQSAEWDSKRSRLIMKSLQWRHNGHDDVSYKSPASRLFINRLFKYRPKKTPKLRVTGLCAGNSPVTGE